MKPDFPTPSQGGAAALEEPSAAERQEAFLEQKLSARGTAERELASVRRYQQESAAPIALSRALVELGLASEEDMARWVADFNALPCVGARDLTVSPEVRGLIPEALARTRGALALGRLRGRLRVAIADPLTPQLSQVLHALRGEAVDWVIAPGADIAAAVQETYANRIDLVENEAERFVEAMFREAAHTRGLSDIHLVPEARSLEIRWRIDGELVPWRVVSGPAREALMAQVKLASTRGPDGATRGIGGSGGLDVSNRLDAQDASASRDYGSRRMALRFSCIPALHGESVVIRFLDQGAQVGSFDDLGMLGDTGLEMRRALRSPNGLILVAGPTGHGKSTTLAACVPWLDVRSRRVLSVEDPVEYRLRGVTQVPVTPRLSFASALRGFLRHNPDVIFVGEIRDSETAALGIRLALTGHLIISTVHATSALQALCRMMDLGVEASLLACTIRLLVGQRLVRRLCPHCRRPHPDGGLWSQRYAALLDLARSRPLFGVPARGAGEPRFFEAGGGCPACRGTGFLGRLGLFEFRCVDPETGRQLALERERFDSAAAERRCERALAEGGTLSARTMRQDGILKAALGASSPEEALAATSDGSGAPGPRDPLSPP